MFPQWSPTLFVSLPQFTSYSFDVEMQLAKCRKWGLARLNVFHRDMLRRFANLFSLICFQAGKNGFASHVIPGCRAI